MTIIRKTLEWLLPKIPFTIKVKTLFTKFAKLKKRLKQKKLKKLWKWCEDNSNLYFACLTRFYSHSEFYFLKVCSSFVPDFKNLHYLVHVNGNMIGTLVNSKSEEEIVLDITGFHDEEVLNKQSLTGCDHSESHLNEEGNPVLTLNG